MVGLAPDPTCSGDPESVHVGAVWTADSLRIVFSNCPGIAWIDRTSGDTGKVPLDSLTADAIIAWPVDLTADDTITFRADLAEDDEQSEGAWQVELDGSYLTHLVVASDIAPSRLAAPWA